MSESFPHELPIPPDVLSGGNHREILRVWVGEDRMNTMLLPDLWEEPGHWGIALMDIVRHISNAHAERHGQDAKKVMQRVLEVLIAELEHPTDQPRGEWHTP